MANRPAARWRRHARNGGFALLIVMILIILLTILVFAFKRDVTREVVVTANVRDDLRASYIAQMAMVRGQVILRLDDHADYDSLNEPWAQPVSWTGESGGPEGDAGDGSSAFTPPDVRITDEERKFNLLTLVRGNETQRKKAAQTLSRLIDICRREDGRLKLDGAVKNVRHADDESVNTDTLIRNLVSYLTERVSEDSGDLKFSLGPGEKADVRSMKKQTPWEMLTVGELLQVEGWDDKLLYGPVRKVDQAVQKKSDTSAEEDQPQDWKDLTDEERFEKRRDSIESIDQRSTDSAPLPLIDYITLYSTGFININTAPREVLLALDKDLTWDAVDQIVTAREQDRQDIETADENGGTLPDDNTDTGLDGDQQSTEEEDKASYRPQDLASFQAFVQRTNNQAQDENGEAPQSVEGLTEKIYNAIRPWLVVKSTVFEVQGSAKVGKVRRTFRAVYRRTGSNPAQASNTQPTDGGTQPADGGTQPADGGTTDAGTTDAGTTDGNVTSDGTPLPAEPKIKLTLLFRDIASQ